MMFLLTIPKIRVMVVDLLRMNPMYNQLNLMLKWLSESPIWRLIFKNYFFY